MASWKSSIFKGTLTSSQNFLLHQASSNFFPSPLFFYLSLSLLSFLLIGIQAASLQSRAISAPEYPSVLLTSSSISTPSVFYYFKFILNISLLPISVGRGMQIRFSRRLLMASSRSQGRFVAPITTIDLPSYPELTPSIRVISQVFTLRLDSSSFSPLLEAKESIQSMKTVAGAQKAAISNSKRTSFQDQPFHFDAKLEAVTLKKVVLPVEAMALASKVLPVPGGPNSSTPFQAFLLPLKSCGNYKGKRTASSKTVLALSSSAMSSNVTLGLKHTTYFSSISIKLESGPLPSGQQCFKKDFLSSPQPDFFSSFTGFFALSFHGLGYSLLAPPFTTPLLLLLADGGALFLLTTFLSTGFFLGQISASLSSNSLSLYFSAYFQASLSLFLIYLSFQPSTQQSQQAISCFLNLGCETIWSLAIQ